MTAHIVRLGDVGSTNDEARARFTGAPLWVTAERQTAGRGRRGRPWVSDRGNLYASHAFSCTWPAPIVGLLPLAAALALADAIAERGGTPALKWPNDVLLAGKKVSGILIETAFVGAARTTVIGFGVNIASAPPDVPATTLTAHTPATVDTLFAALAKHLPRRLLLLDAGDVAAVRAAWLKRAVGLGGPITVRLETTTLEGTFEGLDDQGRLVLRQGEGTRHIAAGDVFLRTPAPADTAPR
ncbi:MAG: biotin--[acetyl-CoA-carboxylase] ligase [Pseudomonadota bacterium]